ncbi:Cytochrome f [Glycine soja]
MREGISGSISISIMIYIIIQAPISNAYPNFAHKGYENLQDATGRIVCANCHLANKPMDIEVPQAVLLDTVFEAVVRIPYDMQVKQVLANGKKGALNVGVVLILPKLAPPIIYLDGSKSNNNVYNATSTGRYKIIIVDALDGREVIDIIPPGQLLVLEGESIKIDRPL